MNQLTLDTQILEKNITEKQNYPNYKLILLNDDVNTFNHVEYCLIKYIPGMTVQKAHIHATETHIRGFSIIWCGPQEQAELYYEQLKAQGLNLRLEKDG